MRIIFISATCSLKQYEEICSKRRYPLLDSSQKFFDMFLKGFAELADVKIDCICVPPVSHGTYPGMYIKARQEVVNNITYHSMGVINYPILKSLTAQRAVKRKLHELVNACREEIFIVADPLLLEGAVPSLRVGKKYGIKTIGFLTDLPDYANECDEHSLLKKVLYRYYNKKCNQYLQKFSQYIFLTEAMNDTVNYNKKPWLLMECLVDISDIKSVNEFKKNDIPSLLYAGKMHKQFGLDILAEATDLVEKECIFHIYGDGNYRKVLERRAVEQSNVCVHGIVPVSEVIKAEMNSTLLVNPRTSQGEFTKYSFPSKTAEYMLTGVPVVMFKLPGIPDEYDSYLYYAENETAEGLAKKIDEVLSLPMSSLVEKGRKAREFVMREKNSVKQAERFIEFCTINEEKN